MEIREKDSEMIRARVEEARKRQEERYRGKGGSLTVKYHPWSWKKCISEGGYEKASGRDL